MKFNALLCRKALTISFLFIAIVACSDSSSPRADGLSDEPVISNDPSEPVIVSDPEPVIDNVPDQVTSDDPVANPDTTHDHEIPDHSHPETPHTHDPVEHSHPHDHDLVEHSHPTEPHTHELPEHTHSDTQPSGSKTDIVYVERSYSWVATQANVDKFGATGWKGRADCPSGYTLTGGNAYGWINDKHTNYSEEPNYPRVLHAPFRLFPEGVSAHLNLTASNLPERNVFSVANQSVFGYIFNSIFSAVIFIEGNDEQSSTEMTLEVTAVCESV